MEREVRYCTTEDGVRIAYCVEGDGPPLVSCPHLFESFSLEHLLPQLSAIRRLIGQGHQVVRYDARGTGLSQREVGDVSPAALVLDLEAVVRAARVTRFAFTGTAFSGGRAIEYTVRHPELVTHLVLWGAYGRFADFSSGDRLRAFSELARADWGVAVQAFVDREFRESRELPDRDLLGFGRLMRESVTGEMATNILLEMVKSSDVRALLPRVHVPTLVITRETDIEIGQELALNIPDARFVVLGRGSSFVLENARPGIEAIHAFLGDEGLVSESDGPAVIKDADKLSERSVRTVLFTDIVGHTEMMQRLGDEKGRDVLREHERITRAVLKANGGTEVKTMGDGFLASFGSVTKAVECAIALQKGFAEWNAGGPEPLHVRVGLNAGEPIEEEGDLFGSTVILASRIASAAKGGEILAADVVHGLCSGKPFTFAGRGEQALRGFENPVRLFEVSWR
jgi:class 3 adenylate cyclase/pimeloyl-ACP methyl ester carboxylesterase